MATAIRWPQLHERAARTLQPTSDADDGTAGSSGGTTDRTAGVAL